jgi:hypothetical protein
MMRSHLPPTTSRSSTNFPTPSQTSSENDGTVVVPSGDEARTIPVTNRAETLKPEPRPTTSSNRASNLKPEPRPAGTPVATSSSNKPSTRQTPSTRSNSSTSSRQATRSQQSNRTGSSTRQTSRSQESTTSSRSSKKTQQTASLQYTSDGLPILRPGMRGSEVTRLQRRLQRLGYLEENAIDGDFGPSTEAAVISLQKRYGLEADGIVGGGTWEILNRRRRQ